MVTNMNVSSLTKYQKSLLIDNLKSLQKLISHGQEVYLHKSNILSPLAMVAPMDKRKVKFSESEASTLFALSQLGFKFITRDRNNFLTVFKEYPFKGEYAWDCNGDKYSWSYAYTFDDRDKNIYFNNTTFKAIRWQDTEAYSIFDLLEERLYEKKEE